jgi:hypothetical protein
MCFFKLAQKFVIAVGPTDALPIDVDLLYAPEFIAAVEIAGRNVNCSPTLPKPLPSEVGSNRSASIQLFTLPELKILCDLTSVDYPTHVTALAEIKHLSFLDLSGFDWAVL